MTAAKSQQGPISSAYAGLDFIKAAFCPLEFTATKLGKHPDFAQLRKDKALAMLEVGDSLTSIIALPLALSSLGRLHWIANVGGLHQVHRPVAYWITRRNEQAGPTSVAAE